MSQQNIPEIYRRLYIDFLQSLATELHTEPSLEDIALDITIASMFTNTGDLKLSPSERETNLDSLGPHVNVVDERELFIYGTPARHHLKPSIWRRLIEEIQATLHSMTEFFYGDLDDQHNNNELEVNIQAYRDEVESLRHEIRTISQRIMGVIVEITKDHEGLDIDLKQAAVTTFPAQDASRTASVDLLAAIVETSLIKLSLTRARFERAIYHHRPIQEVDKESKNVAQAISTAYTTLKNDERDFKIESSSLDRQLQEYETLLQLVDGGSGGYQQIINDWTKVRQETDECVKDLRRLGWTGD